MGQKDISPTRLTSARTSFKAMEATLINSANFFIVLGITSTIDEGTTNIKAMTASLVDTVDSLDGYLNAVALAFSKTDQDLATNINEGTKVFKMKTDSQERYVRSKNENIRRTKAYNSLY